MLFTSSLNRTGLVTYNKTDGIGRIEISSVFSGEEKKYEFTCVFTGDMHFYKGNFETVSGKELFIKNISVSAKRIDGTGIFLSEKRFSINISYIENNENKSVSFGFYRRYRHLEQENSAVICNFVQTTTLRQLSSSIFEETI